MPAEIAAPAMHRARRPVLRVLGTAVTLLPQIRERAAADLGLQLEFIRLDGVAAQRRGALQPESFDIYDQWFHDIDLIWPTRSIQPIETARIARWAEINDLPKTGRLRPGAWLGRGGNPCPRLYVQHDGALGDVPSDRISMLPTVHNADGFAVVGAADTGGLDSWACLLDPDFAGRVSLQNDAAIGALDMALALEAKGERRFHDIGNLSLEEIDAFSLSLTDYVAHGHFRGFWADEDAACRLMGRNTPAIGSLWWSALVEMRVRGIPAVMATPREGYRGWYGGMALSARLHPRLVDPAYDYLNWWLDGFAGAVIARNGSYIANPSSVRDHLSAAEWAFWYDGAPAAEDIRDPAGRAIFAKGDRREGGAYADRMSRVTVWDTVMEEHNYLARRWGEAIGSL